MKDVRVVEVAQFTFVPAAGAILADWGAHVIKIEHAERGDAQRGTTHLGSIELDRDGFNPLMEHSNRGKRSIGLSLEQPGALEVLASLVRGADVFLTNFLPETLDKLKITYEDLRAINPSIIYVRGTAHGGQGPERDRGGFDFTSFWTRAGGAGGTTPEDADWLVNMPAPAYGDSIGGMTIAGGVAAALFARDRTGQGSLIDVSLLSVGAWASGLAVDLALLSQEPWRAQGSSKPTALTNPLSGTFRTADGRWIALHLNQMWRWWEDFWQHLGRPDVIADARFSSREGVIKHAPEVAAIVAAEIGACSLDELTSRFDGMAGPWAAAQNSYELGHDPALRNNGFIVEMTDRHGTAREMVANPVQFDETPPDLIRAPQFAEHTDEILHELALNDEEILQLKIAGAVT